MTALVLTLLGAGVLYAVTLGVDWFCDQIEAVCRRPDAEARRGLDVKRAPQ